MLFRRTPPSLDELASRHGTDKSSSSNAFTEKYVPFLEARRDEPLTLLEIGVHEGGSLRMWHDYFPRAWVYGVDVRPEVPRLSELERVRVEVLDASDPTALAGFAARVAAERGGFDLVIDDASHVSSHQIGAFKTLFPHVRPGGIYFVEDVTTSYAPEPYGGGVGRPDTFLSFARDLIPFIPMSMGSVPAREPWERDLDFVYVCGYGGLVAVGKLTAERKARFAAYGR